MATQRPAVRYGRPNLWRLEGRFGLIYTAPKVVDFGSIADHTFNTPGGVKGCKENCHLDNFTENSGTSP